MRNKQKNRLLEYIFFRMEDKTSRKLYYIIHSDNFFTFEKQVY